LIFYLVIGLAVAAAVAMADGGRTAGIGSHHRERGRWFTVATAVFFWPLFVPVLLARKTGDAEEEPQEFGGRKNEPDDDLARGIAQVDAELVAALASLDGWAEGAIARERVRINELRAAWRAQAQRIRDVDRVLAAVDVEPLGDESGGDAASRAAQSGRARRENFARLRRVRDQADRDLATTLASVRELVSMIHLAKFTGEPASRADELVTQIAAAVEGLSEVAAWSESPAA
jgi:hypothetical protein